MAPSSKTKPKKKHRAITWRTEEWPFDRFLAVTPAGFNPKDADPDEIASLAEDYRVFGVGRSFAVRDDELLLDGHQSLLAFQLLTNGEHLNPDVLVGGEPTPWEWTPPATVTVRIASGMSDVVARAFIAALTKNRVDRDEKMYGELLVDITSRVESAADDDRAYYQAAVDAIGHDPDELAALLDAATRGPSASATAKGSPKMTLEFTNADLRDRVRVKLAEENEREEPTGHVLARLLGLRVPRAKKSSR